jgi:hypothetical protein
MVIVRLSPGLANQMMEYASGYALARKLKQELVLDISECWKAPKGYLLDYFNIPDSRKVVYFPLDSEHLAHIDILGIPEDLRSRVDIYKQEDERGIVTYNSLKEVKSPQPKDIYLCGYFFSRPQYYDRYWKEIRHNFALKYSMREIEQFRKLIKNNVSVGVHIRRGDMLLTDWAVKMEDNYYKAAMAYVKKRVGKCIFCVFSDDIEYAKKILGNDKTIYYVHFLGYDDADIAEFVCLSLCNHRILSNSSTFSRLADELNGKPDRITVYQSGKFDTKTYLGKTNIKFYSTIYNLFNKIDIKTDKAGNGIDAYRKKIASILQTEVTADNCEYILNEICKVSLNSYGVHKKDEVRLLYQKFTALVEHGEYDNALSAANRIYEYYTASKVFRKKLIKSLEAVGAYAEAELERKYTEKAKHFVIIPEVKTCASSTPYGLVEVGIALHHMGHKVSFVFNPMDESEQFYIKKNKILTNRVGVSMGCRQYLKCDVEHEGIINFLDKFTEKELYIITRDKEFCRKKLMGKEVRYIFLDYTDWRDAESMHGKRIPQENVDYLYHNSDIILTQEDNLSIENKKIIVWKDGDHKENYWFTNERIKFGYLHRMSERVISMVETLVDNLDDKLL